MSFSIVVLIFCLQSAIKWTLCYILNMKNFRPLAEILKNYEQRLLEWETPSSTTNPINFKLAEMQIHHTEICHIYHTRTSWFLFWTQKKEQQVLRSTSAATWKTTSAALWWALKTAPFSSGRKSLSLFLQNKKKSTVEKEAVSSTPSFFRLSCLFPEAIFQRFVSKICFQILKANKLEGWHSEIRTLKNYNILGKQSPLHFLFHLI